MNVPWSRQLEGKYEILEKLGEGGMGTVFKVRHRLLDELRVVKTLRSSLADDKDLQSRFLQEARLASRLRHPNIAELYDFTIGDDGTAFIVMEYIPGISLDSLLETRGPLDIGVILELAIQSLAAIGYLHRRKYIHRDISPDNLMVSRDIDDTPRIKLIDLGIAKVLGGGAGLTVTGMFLGKLRYSSPEQLDESLIDKLDGRSDLYSFGVVLYELLTGRLPFEATSPSAIMAGHLFRPPMPFEVSDPSGRVPQTLRTVILRALSKDRESRLRNATEFASELRALLIHHPADPSEMRRAMESAASLQGVVSARERATSAQARLDRQFTSDPTPVPELDTDRRTLHLAPAQAGEDRSIAKVGVLVAGAQKFFELGQYTAASEQLEAILALSPDHPEARELYKRARSEELKSKISEALGEGDLETAETWLNELQKNSPNDETLGNLWSELRNARRCRAVELFDRARSALDRGRLDEAAESIAKALALGSDPAPYSELLEAVDQALARKKLTEELTSAFDSALVAAEPTEARRLLNRMLTELGEEVLPHDARGRVARLEIRQRCRELTDRATTALADDRLEEAVSHFEEAAELCPDDVEIVRRLAETQEVLERRRRLDSRARLISAQIVDGELEKASNQLEETEAELGNDEMLDQLRERLATLRIKLEAVEVAFVERDLSAVDIALSQLRELSDAVSVAAPFEVRRDQLATELKRAAQLASIQKEIEEYLDQGKLDAAQDVIEQSGELAASAELAPLLERLAELQRQALLRRIEDDIAASRDLMQAEHWQEAHARLDAAALLAPADDTAVEAIARARSAVEETERSVVVQNRIEDFIATGDLEKARTEFQASAEGLGGATVVARLDERLNDLERLQRVRGLLAAGEELLTDGDFAAAEHRFAAAAELAPQDDHISERLLSTRQKLARREELRKHLENAERLLDAGQLKDVGGSLAAATKLGGAQATAELRQQLEDSLQAIGELEHALQEQRLGAAQEALESLGRQRGGAALTSAYASRLSTLSESSFTGLVTDLKAALTSSDLDAAESALGILESHPYGDRPAVSHLALEVDGLRQHRQATIESARQRIGGLLASDKLTAAGIWFEQLETLDPAAPYLPKLKDELDRRQQTQDEARQRTAALAGFERKIEQARTTRDTALVRDLIEQGEAALGEDSVFATARQQLARLEEEQRLETVQIKLSTGLPVPTQRSPTDEAKREVRSDAVLLRSLGQVATALKARDAARARELLEGAEATWGKGGALESAWRRLARLEHELAAGANNPPR